MRSRIAVMRIADGENMSFEAEGVRARFSRDGHSIVYIRVPAVDIVSQPFPSTAGAPIKVLVPASPDSPIESFQLSPGGMRAVVSHTEPSRTLALAEGIVGVSPPARSK